MAQKRPTTYKLEDIARQHYPAMKYEYYWLDKYARMASKIIGWNRIHKDADLVLILLEEEERTTRSPGKKRAIQDYKEKGIEFFTKPKGPEEAEAPAKG